jgi:hypothetical protein
VRQIYIPLEADENMNKKIILGIVGLFSVMFALNFASAAYYQFPHYGNYGNDKFDSYSYHSERTTGNYGYLNTKTNDYNRVTESFWDGHDWVKRTSYVSERRESPNYGYGGYGGYGKNYYGAYNNYYGGYGNKYGGYNKYNSGYGNYYKYPNYNNYNNYNYPNYGYGYY